MVEFFIPGNPVPKGRPKFSTRGGFVRTYTPAKTRDAENHISNVAREYLLNPLQGPLSVYFEFRLPIPISTPKKRVAALIGAPQIKRPDLDNLAKLASDALNGIAWADDSQVWQMTACKVYSDSPGILVKISPSSI